MFRYAATSEGNKCWCSNDTNGLSDATGSCNTSCAGLTDSTKCGGTVSYTPAIGDDFVYIEQFDTPDLIEGLALGTGGEENRY